MTLTRLSILALALASFTIAACGKDDTGETGETEGDTDTDTDADSDTDTDTDINYFEPYLYSWGFEGGIIGGEAATIGSSHGELPPFFYFELFEKDYLNGYDDRYSCIIGYDASTTAGSSSGADSFFDLVFDLSVPYYSTCDNLDPNVWGDDEYAIFTSTQWELGFEPMGQDLIDIFIKHMGEDKWEEGWEPYTFGVQTYLDGTAIHTMQTMYGYGFPLDGGNLDETAKVMELTDIAMGADGYYNASPFYLWFVN